MFPLHDSRPTKIYPFLTYLIIASNIVVFILEIISQDVDTFIKQFALIPERVSFLDYSTLTPFLTSQFLHAGFFHIISNMWFLKIFGDNVEEKFGRIFYLFVYLLSGVAGGFVQYLFSPNSTIPMLGASGAVAGVLGAYFVFFPHHRIETLIPTGLFVSTVSIPAGIVLFYWFVTQLFSGVGSIAVAQTGGVAFWAHVGGFTTGWAIAKLKKDNKLDLEEGEIIEEFW